MLATVRDLSWVCSASTLQLLQLQFRADARNCDRRWRSGTRMQFRASDAVAGWWRVRAPLILLLNQPSAVLAYRRASVRSPTQEQHCKYRAVLGKRNRHCDGR